MSLSGQPGRGRVIIAALAVFLCLSLSLPPVLAGSAVIAPREVHFERRSATTGSRLSWSWDCSGYVSFSVSRTKDPGALLYAAEGTDDTGYLTVPFDDTYVLLWFNPNNLSVELNYTSVVEPGSGSALLLAVVLVMIVVIISLAAVLASQRRGKGGKAQTPEISDEASAEPPSDVPPPLAPPALGPLPPPMPPSSAAVPEEVEFCRFCGQKAARRDMFCPVCGARLG